MNGTLKMLSSMVTKSNAEKTLEQLAAEYKEGQNPAILAAAFSKTFKLIIDTSNKFYGLNSEDIASFALERLDFCLTNYEEKGVKFSTYFTAVLKNQFRTETQALNTHKRKVVFYTDSYDEMVENGFDVCSESKADDCELLYYDLRKQRLTDRELEYCKLIVEGFTNQQAADELKVSIMTLSNMRKILRKKIPVAVLGF